MQRGAVKTGVVCGSYGLLSKSLNELDKMIKRKEVPPAFTLLRRDGSRVDVDNKTVKLDLSNMPFKHEYFEPNFILVIEGMFANTRDKGMHTLTEDQKEYIVRISQFPFDFVPAEDIRNYRLNICEECEDILINRSLEEFALKSLEEQIKKEFKNGMIKTAEPENESPIFDLLSQLATMPEADLMALLSVMGGRQ